MANGQGMSPLHPGQWKIRAPAAAELIGFFPILRSVSSDTVGGLRVRY